MKSLVILTALSISVLSSGFANAAYTVKIPLEFDWIKFVDNGESGNGDDGSGGTGGENGGGNEGGETPTTPEDPYEDLTEEEKEEKCSDDTALFQQAYGHIYTQYQSGIDGGDCVYKFTGSSMAGIDLHDVVDSVLYATSLHIKIDLIFGKAYFDGLGILATGVYNYTYEYNRLVNSLRLRGGTPTFTPNSAYRETYKGYRLYTSGTSNCLRDMRAVIDSGIVENYYGSLDIGICKGRWSEIFSQGLSLTK